MNAAVITTLPEVALITRALDMLLTVAIETDRRLPPLIRDEGPVSAATGAARVVERLTTYTDAQRRAEDLLRRPVSEALRLAMRTLGERLHEIGGHALMLGVLDQLSEGDPRNGGRRASILDHRWDGIGSWCA